MDYGHVSLRRGRRRGANRAFCAGYNVRGCVVCVGGDCACEGIMRVSVLCVVAEGSDVQSDVLPMTLS